MKLTEISLLGFRENGQLNVAGLASSLSKTLVRPPYCSKLIHFQEPVDEREFRHISDWLGQKSAHLTGRKYRRSSFTKVCVNPAEASRYNGVTGYSRTHLPLAGHTDSSYMPNPHEFVGFQCVVDAEEGGHNTIVPISRLMKRLPKSLIKILQESVFPFGRGEHAILGRGESPTIRYYRGQLDHALERGAFLAPEYQDALNELDKIIHQEEQKCVVKLEPGQALIFDNHRVLHGRTGFDVKSNRLLIRVRQHVDFNKVASERRPVYEGIKYWLKTRSATQLKAPAAPFIQSGGAEKLEDQVAATGPNENYTHLLALDKEHLDDIKRAANLLLKVGRFKEASELFEHSHTLDPNDRSIYFSLSALAYYCGEREKGENYLEQAARLSPFSGAFKTESTAPRILRVRGLKDIKYTLLKGRSGYRESFQRGHFSLQNLCDLQAYNTVNYSIFEGITAPTLPEGEKPDLILNTVACGDRMPGTLGLLQTLTDNHPEIAVINRPEHVLATTRAENARRFSALEGVIFPATKPFEWTGDDARGLAAKIEKSGFSYPFIIRPVGTHTGSGMKKVLSQTEAIRYFQAATPQSGYYVIQYHELADIRGLYTKTRVFFIDGVLYPVARLTHNDWNVHSGDRYAVMDKNPFMQGEERAFLSEPESAIGEHNVAKLYEIAKLVQLDFFGIDFTLSPTGSLFVFECNAAMRHNFDHVKAFPYTRLTLEAVSQAFRQMVNSRVGLLD